MSKIMLPIQQAVANTGKTASGGNGAVKSSGDVGFAGALVQAIGGNGAAANGMNASGANGMAATAVFAGLLDQLGVQQNGDASATPQELLAGLIGQLQAKLQDDDSLPKEAGDQMAEWLSALQAILQQLTAAASQSPTADEANGAAATDAAGTPNALIDLAKLLPTMLETLRQASQTSEAAGEQWKPIAESIRQLQAVLIPSGQADAQAKPAEDGKAAGSSKAATEQPAQIAAQDPQAQAEIAAPVIRKTASTFKEPIVHWNLANVEAGAETSDAPTVQAADNAAQTGDQAALAWTMSGQEAAKTSAGEFAKASVPAQVPVQQFSQQVGNYLVKQFVLSGGNGVTEARISLHPEHLGQVDIRIAMQDGQLTAQFVAHNGTAKELLENQMALLRTSLQGQGIQVDKMEVVQQQQPDLSGSAMYQEQERRGSGSDGESSSKRGQKRADDVKIAFEDEMERSTVLREAGFGGGINVTA